MVQDQIVDSIERALWLDNITDVPQNRLNFCFWCKVMEEDNGRFPHDEILCPIYKNGLVGLGDLA